jgi:molecular chaperone DnaJ
VENAVREDHYSQLGVTAEASNEEIRQAYRRLVMKWHPDRHHTATDKAQAEIRFKAIQSAYSVIGDPDARKRYDVLNKFGGLNPDDFRHPFSEQTQRNWEDDLRSRAPAGADVKWKTSVSLKDAQEGCTVIYPRKFKEPCDDCEGQGWNRVVCPECRGRGMNSSRLRYCSTCYGHGTTECECGNCEGRGRIDQVDNLKIRVPAGVLDGSEMVAKRCGKQSRYGGHNGDLHVTIKIKPEGGWKFAGRDIVGTLKLPFSIALFGGAVVAELPLGRTLEVTIAPRTNSGKKIRLAGAGLVGHDGVRGDAILNVTIVLPKSRKKLAPEVEEAIRGLDAEVQT